MPVAFFDGSSPLQVGKLRRPSSSGHNFDARFFFAPQLTVPRRACWPGFGFSVLSARRSTSPRPKFGLGRVCLVMWSFDHVLTRHACERTLPVWPVLMSGKREYRLFPKWSDDDRACRKEFSPGAVHWVTVLGQAGKVTKACLIDA
jgi:hypothetical protein